MARTPKYMPLAQARRNDRCQLDSELFVPYDEPVFAYQTRQRTSLALPTNGQHYSLRLREAYSFRPARETGTNNKPVTSVHPTERVTMARASRRLSVMGAQLQPSASRVMRHGAWPQLPFLDVYD